MSSRKETSIARVVADSGREPLDSRGLVGGFASLNEPATCHCPNPFRVCRLDEKCHGIVDSSGDRLDLVAMSAAITYRFEVRQLEQENRCRILVELVQ